MEREDVTYYILYIKNCQYKMHKPIDRFGVSRSLLDRLKYNKPIRTLLVDAIRFLL